MHACSRHLALPLHTEEEKKRRKTQYYRESTWQGGFHKTANSTNLDHGCEVSQAMDRDTGSINDPGTAEHTRGIGRAWARTGVVGSPDACRWGHGDDEKPTNRLRIPPRGTCSPAPVGVLPSGLYISGSILKLSLLSPVIGTRALKHICI